MEDINTIIDGVLESCLGLEPDSAERWAIISALALAGYIIVPREPTVAMDEAPVKLMSEVGSFTAAETWRAMISAWEQEQ